MLFRSECSLLYPFFLPDHKMCLKTHPPEQRHKRDFSFHDKYDVKLMSHDDSDKDKKNPSYSIWYSMFI